MRLRCNRRSLRR